MTGIYELSQSQFMLFYAFFPPMHLKHAAGHRPFVMSPAPALFCRCVGMGLFLQRHDNGRWAKHNGDEWWRMQIPGSLGWKIKKSTELQRNL